MVMVVLVGSVPVSPRLLLMIGDLKSQIVLICLVSFFDLLVFIALSFDQNYPPGKIN